MPQWVRNFCIFIDIVKQYAITRATYYKLFLAYSVVRKHVISGAALLIDSLNRLTPSLIWLSDSLSQLVYSQNRTIWTDSLKLFYLFFLLMFFETYLS